MSDSLLISTMSHPLFDVSSADETYLAERLQFLRDCGIQALDLNLDRLIPGDPSKGETGDFWNQSLDELYAYFTPLKQAVENAGLVFSQMHAAFPIYVPDNEPVTEYMCMSVEKSLAVAAFFNCPALVVHPWSTRKGKEMEREVNLNLYRRFIPFARQYGVKVCLENMFNVLHGNRIEGSCSTAEDACWYIDKLNEEAGEDLFGFCFDIGHATVLHRDTRAFVQTLGHRLTCLHLHDNNGDADLHVMPFTQLPVRGVALKSATDWEGLFKGLREIGYKGNLSFEASKSFSVFPEETHPELLSLYSAIGRYFRNRIRNG